MKKIFLLSITLSSVIATFAQFNSDYLKIADEYFRKQDYASAAPYYEKCLAGNGKNKKNKYNPYAVETSGANGPGRSKSVGVRDQAVYNLAECYRMLNYPAKAEGYYKEALAFDKKKFPLAGYHYATALRALEKFNEAEKEFQSFLDTYQKEDAYSTSAKREIQNLRFIQSQLKKKDLSLYTVTKQVNEMNKEGANYAAVWVNDNTLLFTSSRADSNASKYHVHANRLYLATYENGIAGRVNSFPLTQDKDVHQGAAALSADGNTVYFTRWKIKNGKKNAAIYTSRKNGDKWSEPVALNEKINISGYNSQQPFLLPDGKLLFASDQPGGKGGFDLWMADPLSGSAAVNLGDGINTSFDEQAPYYHAAGGALVFSSNGRVGMGGFDFFESKGKPGNWAEPVNMGYPVNSVKDDLYFVSRGSEKNILEDVLISSDRSAACCLELFSIRKKVIKQVKGIVVDCETKQPLTGVAIRFSGIAGSASFDKTTGSNGAYSFTLEEFKPMKAEAVLEGYDNAVLEFNAPENGLFDVLNNDTICLRKSETPTPDVGEVIVMENVYYEFNQYKLSAESYPALDKIVELLNSHPAMRIEIRSHTDAMGNDAYNEKLSQQRAQSCVDYLAGKGIHRSRLEAAGYGEKVPIEPNTNDDGSDNAEGRKKNRRTEFKVLEK